MSNKLSAVLILYIATVGLVGCDLLRVSGPCYGVGCPGGTAGRNAQYKPGEAPKAQNAFVPAPTPAQTASAPTQSPATQSTTAQADSAQPANAQAAAAQPAPAQDTSSEAKSSPLHSIGEFFAHLIPHHNSDAKSGASD
jgi:hypothetical protein